MLVGNVSRCGSMLLPAVGEQDEDDEDITDGGNLSSPPQRGRKGGSPIFGLDGNCVGDDLEDDEEDYGLEEEDGPEDDLACTGLLSHTLGANMCSVPLSIP
jgi:hypothetical protein